MIRKIALLPGHSSRDGGSVCCAGVYKGLGEYGLAKQEMYLPGLVRELRRLGYEVVCTEREAAGGVTPSYSAKAANATGADLALEFHFNACGGATGAEVLYYGYSGPGRRFAEVLSWHVAEVVGVRDRGALPVYEPEVAKVREGRERCTGNGWFAFKRSVMPFFMVEPCFAGSNPDEARLLCECVRTGAWAVRMAFAIDAAVRAVYV